MDSFHPQPPTAPLTEDWPHELPDEDSAENQERRRELLKKKWERDNKEEVADE